MFDAGIIRDEIYKGHRIIVKRIVGGGTFHGIPSHWYCGYVEVKKGSKFYGKDYRDIETEFDVHGGLTFSGELEDVEGYFFGFDCAHFGDSPFDQDANYTLKMCKKLVNQIEVKE